VEPCPDLAELSEGQFLEALVRKLAAAEIPFSASIELTERCNLRCVHCLLGDQSLLQRRRSDELGTADWLGILDQIAALGTLRLLITGGDPLLRPDFADVYRHAKQLGLVVTVFTNGTMVTPELVELFRDLPPYAVEISLYGATAATHEAITGVPGSFQRCLDGIERLRSAGVDLGLKTILMKSNQHELDGIAALARSLGKLTFRFDTEIQGGFGGDRRPLAVRLEPEEAVRAELSCLETAKAWTDFIRRRERLKPAPADTLYSCGAGKSGFSVDPYGRLHPCLVVRHIAHDLRGATLAAGLAAIREQLAAHKTPLDFACSTCEDRTVCSACPAFALQELGIEDRPAAFQCSMTRIRRRVFGCEAGAKES
jgi:radical SAM protein with 4Fe4S-binding SPASM domain